MVCAVYMYVCVQVWRWQLLIGQALGGKTIPLSKQPVYCQLCVEIRWLSVIYDHTNHMLIHFPKIMSILFSNILLPKSTWIDFQ